MSRLHFKGGAWTNAEDQVLLAGLSQYGIRDWERVASLLVKKTAAQCRERWENYLDPRLNLKEAWSVEEEEKLVQLQTLFPNQWKLISAQLTRSTPNKYIRPAWLCEEHYLELKDAFDYEREQSYNNEQNNVQSDNNMNSSTKKLTFEEFMALRRRKRAPYKAHEEKPARSDIIANDLYEKEMIEMAISRLANQDQKKGLRKERQRQLEEARFLAKLENNREGLVSGTLSERQAKRIRRAIEEDAHGVDLTDNVYEQQNNNESSEEWEEKGKANKRAKKEGEFTPIDLNDEEARAGTSHKQRTLLKRLDGQNDNNNMNDDNTTFHSLLGNRAGVNAELLENLVSNKDESNSTNNIDFISANKIELLEEKSNKVATPALTWDALATSVTSSNSFNFAQINKNNNINRSSSIDQSNDNNNNISSYLNVLQQSETPLTSLASSESNVPNLDLLFAELNADVAETSNENDYSKMLSDNNKEITHMNENEKIELQSFENDRHIKSNDQFVHDLVEYKSTEYTETMPLVENNISEELVEPSTNRPEDESEKEVLSLYRESSELSLGRESASLPVLPLSTEESTDYKYELDKARRMIDDVMHKRECTLHDNNVQQSENVKEEKKLELESKAINKEFSSNNVDKMISDVNSSRPSQLERAKEMIEAAVHDLHNEYSNKDNNIDNNILEKSTEENKLLLRSNDIHAEEAIHELEHKVKSQRSRIREKQWEQLHNKAHWLISTFYDQGNDTVVHDLIQEREELMEIVSTMENNNERERHTMNGSSRNNSDDKSGVTIAQYNGQIARINTKIVDAICNYWIRKLRSAQQELHFLRSIRAQEHQEMREQLNSAQCTLQDAKKRERALQTMYKEYRQQMLSEETQEELENREKY